MNRSDNIAELAAALSKAQGAMTFAEKDATNPAFRSKYATLASLIDAVRVPFSSNGLSFAQLPVDSEHGVAMETMLMHSSGQWISGVTIVPVDKNNAHGIGSATTYARKYGLSAIAGIAADEDDDGNSAAKAAPAKRGTPTGRQAESVAQTALNADVEAGATVDWSLVTDTIASLRAALFNEDEVGVYELAEGLDNIHKMAIWTKLDSKERAAIKKIVDKYRAADKATT